MCDVHPLDRHKMPSACATSSAPTVPSSDDDAMPQGGRNLKRAREVTEGDTVDAAIASPATSTNVVPMKLFQPNRLSASNARRNPRGGLSVNLTYRDPQTSSSSFTLIQTPKLRVPFGLQIHDEGDSAKHSLSLSFDFWRDSDCVEADFINGIRSIDDHVKHLAAERSEEWFKKPMRLDVVSELFKDSVKCSPAYPPLLKVKIPSWNNEFRCDVYNPRGDRINLADALRAQCTVIALIQPQSVWFVDKSFGIIWVARQLMVYEAPRMDRLLINPALTSAADAAATGDDSDAILSQSD
jgi:hypothetical protein